MRSTILLLLSVFVVMGMHLPICCLASNRGIHLTEPLPCNDTQEYSYWHTDWWEKFIKYTLQTGSVSMIYAPSFIKTGSGIQKLMVGIYTDTYIKCRSHKPTSYSGLKIVRVTQKCTGHTTHVSVASTTFVWNTFCSYNWRLALKMHIERHVYLYIKCLLFLFDFNCHWNMPTNFSKTPHYQIL
jgi:hypothetical protein